MSMRAPADQRLLRRRLLRWTAPLAVLAALAGGKLLAMSGAAQVAQSSFLVGNGETAERASAILAVANVVETFKAPFAAGTVAAADARTVGDLVHAEELLREALALAIDADQCAVRYNLALVIEGRGDVAQDQAEAERLFREASAVASGAPAGCRELPPLTSRPLSDAQEQEGEADEDQAEGEDTAGRTAADDLRAAAARASGKAQSAREAREAAEAADAAEAGQPGETPGEPPQEPPPPDPARAEELQGRLIEAAMRQQRADDGRAAADLWDAPPAPTVPAPW